jgi:hypothetical protein
MRKRTFTVALIAAGLVVGCASRIPMADSLPAAPDAVPQLVRGRTLLVNSCTPCHRMFWPDEYSPRQWRPIAERMGRRSFFSDDQTADLRAYAAAASRHTQGAAPSTLPTVESLEPEDDEARAKLETGRTLLANECVRCHRVYAPDEYTADEWVPIVATMARESTLSPKETAALRAYVVAAAAVPEEDEEEEE